MLACTCLVKSKWLKNISLKESDYSHKILVQNISLQTMPPAIGKLGSNICFSCGDVNNKNY